MLCKFYDTNLYSYHYRLQLQHFTIGSKAQFVGLKHLRNAPLVFKSRPFLSQLSVTGDESGFYFLHTWHLYLLLKCLFCGH